MNENKPNSLIKIIIAILAFLGISGGAYSLGSAPSGLMSSYGSSSTLSIGNNVGILFPQTFNCASRVITTQSAPILIQFTSSALASTSLNAVQGTVQLASTTVTYDSGLYGCGVWTTMGFGGAPTTTISLVEFR